MASGTLKFGDLDSGATMALHVVQSWFRLRRCQFTENSVIRLVNLSIFMI